MRHDERLTVPRLWHLWAVLFATIFGSYPAAYTGAMATRIPVYLGMLALAELGLWLLGRARITVSADCLEVDGRAIALGTITAVEVLTDVRAVLVPGAPARTRPWIHSGVRVATAGGIAWVLSSRQPAHLADAIGVATRA